MQTIKAINENFYDLVYNTFYKFSHTRPENVGLSFSRYISYPILKFVPEPVMLMPLPKDQGDKILFHGLLFKDDVDGEKGVWGAFLSTLYTLSTHARLSDYSIYEKWRKGKTENVCWKVIDFIEDTVADHYLSTEEKEIFENINTLKLRLATPKKNVKQKDGRRHKTKKTPAFNSGLIAENIAKVKREIIQNFENGNQAETKLKIADKLYNNRDLLPTNISMFCAHHVDDTEIKVEKFVPVEFEPSGMFAEKMMTLTTLWDQSESVKYKLLRRYSKPLRNLNFDKVSIPAGDIHSYARMKLDSLPVLGRIREQMRVITNMMDDPVTDQIGFLDMQMAIQAIASEGQSTDIFERDELRRGEEAWVILIDKSASMKLRFDRLKEFTVCVSESAEQLSGKGKAWALYSFDNNFEILKDFEESFSQEVQARIGSLEESGLSLLPDAIELAYRVLMDNPHERKCIFVITDGTPTGYDKIQEAFKKVVKTTETSDITLIAIGVSGALKKGFTNYARGRDLKQLVSKFISAYRRASDM